MHEKFLRYMNGHPLRWLAWYFIASLIFVFGLGVTVAMAADVSVTWTQPSQNTDGSAIPATGAGSIASNRIEWGSCSGSAFGVKAGEKVVTPAATSTTVTNLPPSTWCFRAYATNTYGTESGPSNAASKVIPPPTPNPPVLTVVNIVAYEIRQHPRGVVSLGRNVGTVPLGTACGVKVTGSYYEVPLDTVSLARMPKSAIVVAQCAAS